MASITLSFDVKISIVRPYITKNITDTDLGRITQTTNLKYETLQTLSPQSSGTVSNTISNEEVLSSLAKSLEELDEIYDDFAQLEKKAGEALEKIVFSYDVLSTENELLANAERAIFGSASGVITYSKYQKLLELEQIFNREIQERMVTNGGTLNVVA